MNFLLLLWRRLGLYLRLFFGSLWFLGWSEWQKLWFTRFGEVCFGTYRFHLVADTYLQKLTNFGMIWEVFYENAYPIDQAKKYRVIVDIGAHIGSFSVRCATAFPEAKIYAFEPSPASFRALQLNGQPYGNMDIFNLGISDRKMTADFFLNAVNPAQNSVSGKLGKKIVVDFISLREFFSSNRLEFIDLLKVDCEGSEYDIFFSSVDLLPAINEIYLELHDPEYFQINTPHRPADLVGLLKKQYRFVDVVRIDAYTCYVHARTPMGSEE